MLVCGTVLKSERIVGSSGERSWDFHQVHVLDGIQVLPCLVGRDYGTPPEEGETLLVEVEVGTRRNNRSGAYEVTVTLVRPADPNRVVEYAEPLAARAA